MKELWKSLGPTNLHRLFLVVGVIFVLELIIGNIFHLW